MNAIALPDQKNFSQKMFTEMSEMCHSILAGDVWVAVPTQRILPLLSDRRFKNCFEAGSEGRGGNNRYRRERLEYETDICGIPATTPLPHRPIYGYIGSTISTQAEIIYGGFHFKLTPAVKTRATVTVGDSFLDELTPIEIRSLYHFPHLVDGNDADSAEPSTVWNELESTDSLNPPPGSVLRRLLDHAHKRHYLYTEIQIVGGVTLGEVESVTVSRSGKTVPQWRRTAEIIRRLEKENLPVRIIEN